MDYLELVDWSGKQIRNDKRGHIDNRIPAILDRLSLSQQECLTLCTELEKKPRVWIGSTEELNRAKNKLGKKEWSHCIFPKISLLTSSSIISINTPISLIDLHLSLLMLNQQQNFRVK